MLANTIARTQMERGLPTQFFSLQHKDTKSNLISHTLVTHLWEFLNRANVALGCSDVARLLIPSLSRQHDSNIMETMYTCNDFSIKDQIWLSEWRLYLNAFTIADISNSMGTRITTDANQWLEKLWLMQQI